MGGGSGDTAEPAWLRYDLVGDTRSGDTARQWAAGFPMNLVAADVTPEIDEVKLGAPYLGCHNAEAHCADAPGNPHLASGALAKYSSHG